MKTTSLALDLIKQSEGYVRVAKPCPAGLPTFGWGTTTLPDGSKVENGWETDPIEATGYLLHFVEHVCEPLADTYFGKGWNDYQYGAIISWVYNMRHNKIISGAYSLPGMCKRFIEGDASITEGMLFDKWVEYCNPGTSAENGLKVRRYREICMFKGYDHKLATSDNLPGSMGVEWSDMNWRDILEVAERDPLPPLPSSPPVTASQPPDGVEAGPVVTTAEPAPVEEPAPDPVKPVVVKKAPSPNARRPEDFGLESGTVKPMQESERYEKLKMADVFGWVKDASDGLIKLCSVMGIPAIGALSALENPVVLWLIGLGIVVSVLFITYIVGREGEKKNLDAYAKAVEVSRETLT